MVATKCPHCGIQKPFHCDCEDMVETRNGAATVLVAAMGTVHVNSEIPTQYDVLLKVKDVTAQVSWDLALSPTVALELADKLRHKAKGLIREELLETCEQ